MADEPAAKEHYSVKYQREIDALKAENAALKAAATSPVTSSGTATGMPDPMFFAAVFTAAHEAMGMGTESLQSLLMDRWHEVRGFVLDVQAGKDIPLYNARVEKERLQAERLARIKAEDEAGERRKRERAIAAQKAAAEQAAPADAS